MLTAAGRSCSLASQAFLRAHCATSRRTVPLVREALAQAPFLTCEEVTTREVAHGGRLGLRCYSVVALAARLGKSWLNNDCTYLINYSAHRYVCRGVLVQHCDSNAALHARSKIRINQTLRL